MIRKRPTSVLVIAILHLVGAALLLLCSVYSLVAQGIASGMQPTAGAGGPGAVSQQQLAGEASFQKARTACLEARGYTVQ